MKQEDSQVLLTNCVCDEETRFYCHSCPMLQAHFIMLFEIIIPITMCIYRGYSCATFYQGYCVI